MNEQKNYITDLEILKNQLESELDKIDINTDEDKYFFYLSFLHSVEEKLETEKKVLDK